MSKRIYYSKDGTRMYYATVTSIVAPSAGAMRQLDAEPYIRSYTNPDWSINRPTYIIWQFSQPVTLDRLSMLLSTARGINCYVCLDDSTTDGVDGNWTWVGSLTTVAYTNVFANLNPAATKWFRIKDGSQFSFDLNIYALHIFGSYDAARFTLWESDESSEIINNDWLDFADAPNHIDYYATKSFKVRNDTLESRDYKVSAIAQDYAGSAVLDSTFYMSNDDGVTLVKDYEILGVAPGAFTPIIYTHIDMPIADNPGVAAHYPRISIEEINA